MNIGNVSANAAIPGEYRKTAERLFPKDGFSKGQKPDLKAVGEFAKALGISADYQRLFAIDKISGEFHAFLEQFQNNMELLIKKTWVEQAEEKCKGVLHEKIPHFALLIERGEFTNAIKEFSTILDELAYLFFGSQSGKADFTEYTFRIDVQMGLFWWYGGRLASLIEYCDNNEGKDDKILWAILLLGLCYLTNF
jgi:hypothetical protein